MENKSNKKESKKMTAKGLIEKGKKQGSLTLAEIMEAFSETELDKDQVENLYETLGNLGIEVIENKTSERGGRAQDKETANAMQKLRSLGYM